MVPLWVALAGPVIALFIGVAGTLLTMRGQRHTERMNQEARMDKLIERMDGLEGKQNDLGGKLVDLRGEVSDLRGEVSAMREEMRSGFAAVMGAITDHINKDHRAA